MKEIIDQEWQHFAYAKATKQEYNVVGKAITRAVVTGKEKNDETCIYNWIGECLDKFSVQQLFDYLCSVRNLEGHMRNYMEQQIINDEINKINWELGERNKL